jgi:RHS repeat-associated protein
VEHYYHVDHLGTSQRLTNTQGETTWRMVSEAFGKTFVDTTLAPTTTGTTTNNFRFPGQYEDVETGTYYNFMRTYLPMVGRYGETDPIGLYAGLNTYTYVEGNPVSLTDPLGLWAWGDPVDQDIVDAVTGFGDAFLISELLRDALDIDGGVDQCSASYRGGKATGFVWGAIPFALSGGAALGAGSKWLSQGRWWRIGNGKTIGNARFGLGKDGVKKVPMLRVGNGRPSDLNHIDLRSRLPKIAPLGGPGECGCP